LLFGKQGGLFIIPIFQSDQVVLQEHFSQLEKVAENYFELFSENFLSSLFTELQMVSIININHWHFKSYLTYRND